MIRKTPTDKFLIDVIREISSADRRAMLHAIKSNFCTMSIGGKPIKPHPLSHQYKILTQAIWKYLYQPNAGDPEFTIAKDFFKKYAPRAKNNGELIKLYLAKPIPRKKRGKIYQATLTRQITYKQMVSIEAETEEEAMQKAMAGDTATSYSHDPDDGADKIIDVKELFERGY